MKVQLIAGSCLRNLEVLCINLLKAVALSRQMTFTTLLDYIQKLLVLFKLYFLPATVYQNPYLMPINVLFDPVSYDSFPA